MSPTGARAIAIRRSAFATAALLYPLAIVAAPLLPTGAIATAALLTAALLTGAALARSARVRLRRSAASPDSGLALGAGAPVHLLCLATGGLASPVFPLVVLWLARATARLDGRRARLLCAAVLVALLTTEAWAGAGVTAPEAVEAVVGLSIGLVVGRRLARGAAAGKQAVTSARGRSSRPGGAGAGMAVAGATDAVLAEAGRAGPTDEPEATPRTGGDPGVGPGDLAPVDRPIEELALTLDRLRRSIGAARAVLWDADPAVERARPRSVQGGEAPPAVRLPGDPLGWAWEEGMPLRLETAPDWAGSYEKVCILPLERRGGRAALLTLAFAAGVPLPDAGQLDQVAANVRAFLHMQRREAMAIATRERFAMVTDVLRRLPRETSMDAFAAELVDAGIRLSGGTGAAVALWEDDAGRVLAVGGEDGGPELGAEFGPLESEMAMAARHGTTIRREKQRHAGSALPVAAPGERWLARPETVVVVPLREAGQGAVGVLAVWSDGRTALDPEAVAILETLAPYAAIQLQQTRIYGDLRLHAEQDALTGLPNRRTFEARFAAASAQYNRYHRPLALIMLDVDHFKSVNDTHGHEAGDAVLQAIAAAIRASIRETDVAARFGGEEFVILMPETGLKGARESAERLRRRVEQSPVAWRGQVIDVSISLGVSAAPECVALADALVSSADAALYASKEAGRNRVTAALAGVDSGP